ncbi:MAG: DUF1570 domain-containing protein [Phycisphaerales bacterium]
MTALSTAVPTSAAPVTPASVDPLSAFRVEDVRTTPWTFEGADGVRVQTPNYDLYTTVKYDHIVERLPRFLEAALVHYRSSIVDLPPPPEPLESYVFNNRTEWEAKTRRVIPNQAHQLRNLGRGGFATRGIAVLYYIDWSGRDRDTLAIAAHEGWHQYTQRTFKHPLPLWLEEGIATYMEGHRYGRTNSEPEFEPTRNWERLRALRRSVRGDRMIPLEDLVSRTPQDFLSENKNRLLDYYGQVWALSHFLVSYEDGKYKDKLDEVLLDAAEGRLVGRMIRNPRVVALGGRRAVMRSRTGPWLLYAYFTDDIKAFEAEYEAYCEKLVADAEAAYRSRRRR